jgi:two-component system cell cycle sensor histidine kinase/response regulator CckA
MPLSDLLDRRDIPEDARAVIRTALSDGYPADAAELLRVQRDLALELLAAETLREGLEVCLRAAIRVLGLDCGGIYAVAEGTEDLVLACHQGLSEEFAEAVASLPINSPRGQQILSGRSLHWTAEELSGRPATAELKEGLRALVAVPVVHQGKVIACLNVASRTLDRIPPSSRHVLETIAGLVGVAIHRFRTVQALSESQTQYRTLVESAPDAIFTVGPDGRFLTANRAAADALGLEPEAVVGKHMSDLFLEPTASRQVASVAHVVESRQPVRVFNAPTLTPVGEWRHNTILTPILGANGAVACVLGIARDVTDYEGAIEALRESEERYRALVESAPDAIFTVDADGTVLSVNPAAARMVGLPAEKAVGRSLRDVFPPELAERRLGVLRRVYETRESVVAAYRETVAGLGERSFSTILSPVFGANGDVICVLGVARDVTERVQAVQALRKSEERYALATEAGRVGVWDWDLKTDELYDSPMLKARLGYADGSPPAGTLGWDRLRHPDDQGKVRQLAEELFAGRRDEYALEQRIRDAEGNYRWILSRGRCVRDAEGRVVRIIGTNTDITEQKEAEEERRQMAARLQQAEKLESLGLLAGGVAHDFRNVLTGLLGNLSLAQRGLGAASPAHLHLERVERAASAATNLAEQMLAYSGHGRIVTGALDLAELLADVGELTEARLPAGARIAMVLPPGLPMVRGDATQLRQVALNLITNATECLGEPGGLVTVELGVVEADRESLARSHVDDKLPEGRYLSLRITDTGPGMDGGTLQRIFDPFFSTKPTGRGLGLASALAVVRGHGGTMRVESKAGEGTTFEVLLPAAEPAEAVSEPAEKVGEPVERCGGTVLIAEDEPLVRAVASALLRDVGFTVLEAPDGREALRLFHEHVGEIGAVVLDLAMPKMDGLGVLREIRRLRAEMPIVVTSAYDGEDALAALGTGGPALFVRKPYRPEQLVATLREATQA